MSYVGHWCARLIFDMLSVGVCTSPWTVRELNVCTCWDLHSFHFCSSHQLYSYRWLKLNVKVTIRHLCSIQLVKFFTISHCKVIFPVSNFTLKENMMDKNWALKHLVFYVLDKFGREYASKTSTIYSLVMTYITERQCCLWQLVLLVCHGNVRTMHFIFRKIRYF